MSRVSQILAATHPKGELYTIGMYNTIEEAAKYMRAKDISALPVLDDNGKLVGMITERDLVRKVLIPGYNPAITLVSYFMSTHLHTVTPFTDMMDCLALMEKEKIRHLLVVENDTLVGIVSLRDVHYILLRDQTLLAETFQAYIEGSR